MQKLQQKQSGFTLIEVLIVMAVMGILAAIAVPIYSGHKRQANRSDGKAALLEAAQRMERFFTVNNTYNAATAGDVFGGDTIADSSEHGLFAIAFVAGQPTANTFVIEATPTGAVDPACNPMTINQAGVKAPAACW